MVANQVWQQIVVDRGDPLPPYQQIANALRHKIATNQLRPGDDMPSVRALSQSVGVTTATVSRTYRALQEEGLIDSQPGVGTVVTDFGKASKTKETVSDQLTATIDSFISGLLRQGYNALDIRKAVDSKLNAYPSPSRLAFVAQAQAVVDKYEKILEAELGSLGVSVVPLTLDYIESRQDLGENVFDDIDYIVTVLSFLRPLQSLIEPLERPISLLLTELSLDTNQKLRDIPKDASVALVAESHYRTTGLGMLQPYCRPEQLIIARDLEPSPLREDIGGCDLIVHTLGTSELVKEVIGPGQKALELEFQPRSDSLRTIRETLNSLNKRGN